jgi:hypothetical protein
MVMTNVLLFAACGFDSPFAWIPQTPAHEPIARARLGAAKKKKLARRTEGRTGLMGTRAIAGGKSAFGNHVLRVFRH